MSGKYNLDEIRKQQPVRKPCEHGIDGIERTDRRRTRSILAALPTLVVPTQNGRIEMERCRVFLGKKLWRNHDRFSSCVSRRLRCFFRRAEVTGRIALLAVENNDRAGHSRLRLAPVTRHINWQQSSP